MKQAVDELAVSESGASTETFDSIKVLPSRWEGIIGFEDQITGDGRVIDPGALELEAPFPLRMVMEDVGFHDGALVVGTADQVERRDGGAIWASGPFDLGGEAGREAARLVAEGVKTGVSMDLDSVEFEIRDDDNNPIEEDEVDDDGMIQLLMGPGGIMATTAGRIRAATLVDIPAFKDAQISAVFAESGDSGDEAEETPDPAPDASDTAETGEDEDVALTASGYPVTPPLAWFQDPKLTEPTPLTITPDGRVYGHLAVWDTCHTALLPGTGECVTAPSSQNGYASFHTGTLLTAEGEVISTGRITMDTDHAGPRLAAAATRSHYDHTGTATADVRAGEDQWGPWVAGALRPDVTPAQVRKLRGSPLSGDWRRVDGNLELVAVLAVNVPGYPVPRPSGLVASGNLASLVASGMLAPRKVRRRDASSGATLSSGDLEYLKRLVARERAREKTDLASRVNRSRVTAMAIARKRANTRKGEQ